MKSLINSTIGLLLIFFAASCASKEPVTNLEPVKTIISKTISNSKISGFAEDAHGHIWIATFKGINKYAAPDFHQFFVSDSIGLRSNIVTATLYDSHEHLWFTTYRGVVTYHENGDFKSVYVQGDDYSFNDIVETTKGEVFFCASNRLLKANETADSLFVVDYFDEYASRSIATAGIDGSLWIAQERSIYKLEPGEGMLRQIQKVNSQIQSSCMMPNGDLWISTENGLVILDTTTSLFKTLPPIISNNSKLLSSSIYEMFLVDNTLVLICTSKNGFYCFNRKTQVLYHESDTNFPIELPNFRPTTIFEDSNGNLWFGSNNQGFKVSNKNANKFNVDRTLFSFFQDIPVISLAYDQSGYMVISTLDKGLYTYDLSTRTIRQIDTSTFLESHKSEVVNFNTIFVDSENHLWLLSDELNVAYECVLNENGLWLLYTVPVPNPNSIIEDDFGGLWIGGTSEDILYIDRKNNNYKKIKLYDSPSTIQAMSLLSSSALLVCSDTQPLMTINPETFEARPLPVDLYSQNAVNPIDVKPYTLNNNHDGSFAIGTMGDGAFVYSITERKFVQVEALAGMNIYSMHTDDAGLVWIGTDEGIVKFNRINGVANKLTDDSGTLKQSFYLRSVLKLPNGVLVFGGVHGITMFDPALVSTIIKRPVIFETLTIQNNLVKPGPNSPIATDISNNPDIEISYNQNSFSIGFSALNYFEGIEPSYSCKLEGFDEYWIDLSDNDKVYYSNLPAGRYTLKVRLSSVELTDEANISSLRIHVKPFPLLSPFALSFYAIFILGVAFMFFFFKRRSRLLESQIAKERLLLEKTEKEHAQYDRDQAKKLNEMQMAYFENVAHEFRTPLTMISGPMEVLAKSETMSKEDKKLVSIVHKSSNWLLMLVNQLLDSSRVNEGQVDLKVAKKDIVSIVDLLYDTFSYKAKTKQILFTTSGVDESFIMWMDEDKIVKILINLLTNAFKFTPMGGRISLEFDLIPQEEAINLFGVDIETADKRYAKFTVKDTGKGIPKEHLEKIFERFYQVDQIGTGTGIGLAYSMALARAHKGYLKAWSSVEEGNSGSTFSLIIPLSNSFYPEEVREKTEETAPSIELPVVDYNDDVVISEALVEDEDNDERPYLVVVDDDVDVANYLKVILSSMYSVSVFYSANMALSSICAEHPDIIISDVAMPGMNGFEFCREIKNNLETSHIPVVLVTAKVTVNNQVEGLESGADAYVTKPFDINYLKALIHSILDNRERAKKNVSSITTEEEIDRSANINPQDKYFLKELYRILENELSNPELDVNTISDLMKMSRTKLYTKIKDLTGESPSVLFKNYKLNIAAKLLLEGKYNMSEIADMTGFSALSHFSSSFKKHFGVPPSDYKG